MPVSPSSLLKRDGSWSALLGEQRGKVLTIVGTQTIVEELIAAALRRGTGVLVIGEPLGTAGCWSAAEMGVLGPRQRGAINHAFGLVVLGPVHLVADPQLSSLRRFPTANLLLWSPSIDIVPLPSGLRRALAIADLLLCEEAGALRIRKGAAQG